MGVCKRFTEANAEAYEEACQDKKQLQVELPFQREKFHLYRQRDNWQQTKRQRSKIFNCPHKGPAISEPSCNAIMRVAEVQDFQLQNAKVEQARAPRGICLVRNHRIFTFKRKQKHLTFEIEIKQTISYKKIKTNK